MHDYIIYIYWLSKTNLESSRIFAASGRLLSLQSSRRALSRVKMRSFESLVRVARPSRASETSRFGQGDARMARTGGPGRNRQGGRRAHLSMRRPKKPTCVMKDTEHTHT